MFKHTIQYGERKEGCEFLGFAQFQRSYYPGSLAFREAFTLAFNLV